MDDSDTELGNHSFTTKRYIYKTEGMWSEFKLLTKLVWPLSLSSFMEHQMFQITIEMFCGHSNSSVLAAFTVASAYANIVASTGIFGISSACDTLFTQGKVIPTVFSNLISNILTPAICFLLIYSLKLGIVGAAFSTLFTCNCVLFIYFITFKIKKYHQRTWDGFTMSAFSDWTPYIELAFPGYLMILVEWGSYEIGSIIAGTIGEHASAVQGVLYGISTSLSMWPLGISVAAGIRIGNLLGASKLSPIKLSVKVLYLLSCRLFSNDTGVVNDCADTLPIVLLVALTDCIATVGLGILNGCGLQKIGALNNFVGYYLCGMPLAFFFAYYLKLGVKGIWYGLLAGSTLQACIISMVVLCINWQNQITLASNRTNLALRQLAKSRVGSVIGLERYSQVSSDPTLPLQRHSFESARFNRGNEVLQISEFNSAQNSFVNGGVRSSTRNSPAVNVLLIASRIRKETVQSIDSRTQSFRVYLTRTTIFKLLIILVCFIIYLGVLFHTIVDFTYLSQSGDELASTTALSQSALPNSTM